MNLLHTEYTALSVICQTVNHRRLAIGLSEYSFALSVMICSVKQGRRFFFTDTGTKNEAAAFATAPFQPLDGSGSK